MVSGGGGDAAETGRDMEYIEKCNFTWHGYRFEWNDDEHDHHGKRSAGYTVMHGRQGNWNDGDRGDERFVGTFKGPAEAAKKQLVSRLQQQMADERANVVRRNQAVIRMAEELE